MMEWYGAGRERFHREEGPTSRERLLMRRGAGFPADGCSGASDSARPCASEAGMVMGGGGRAPMEQAHLASASGTQTKTRRFTFELA